MVFFTCNHCGDSVKKNKVETHAVRCSKSISVSCMDCNKDFNGETYGAHTQCVTELEKYSAKGTVQKPASNKGLVKQQEWVSMINSVIASTRNLPAEDRKLLTIITKYDNIPRKKNKFENFLKNGVFSGNKECVDRVWTMLQEKFTEMKSSDKANTSVASPASKGKGKVEEVENTPSQKVAALEVGKGEKLTKKQKKALKKAKSEAGASEDGSTPEATGDSPGQTPVTNNVKKGKKRKSGAADENGQPNKLQVGAEHHNGHASSSPTKKSKKDNFGFTVDIVEDSPSGKKLKKKRNSANASVNGSPSPNKEGDKKFDWSDAIVKTLDSCGKELPVKVLRKKVLAKYVSETSLPITVTMKTKFHKRLNQAPNVKVLKGKAVLSSTA